MKRRPVFVVAGLALVALAATVVAMPLWRRPHGDGLRIEADIIAGRPDAALARADRWLAADGTSPVAHFYRARALFGLGRDGDCRRELDEAQRLGHPPIPIDRLRAFLLVRAGRYAEAEPRLLAYFRQSAEPDPEADEAMARVFLQNYKLELASRVLRKWKRDAPADPRPYLWHTEIDRRTSVDPSVTIAHYQDALKRDPKLLAARLGLADTLSEARRTEEAEREYGVYLAERPDDAAALVRAAHNASERGDDALAARRLDRALVEDSRSATALRERARLDLKSGDAKTALARLDLATEIDPFEVEGRYTRSLLLKRVGRDDDAKAERAHADRLRAEEKRLIDVRNLLNKDPRNNDLRSEIARWMFDHGKPADGLRWAEMNLADRPDHVATHRLLAGYYEKAGDAGRANYHKLQARSAETASRKPDAPR